MSNISNISVDQMEIGTIIKNLKTSSLGWDHILPKIIKCTVNWGFRALRAYN